MGITFQSGEDDGVTIGTGKAIRDTDKALLIEFTDDSHEEDKWFPKSQIHEDSEVYAVGHEGTVIISSWLAEQEGY